jgi:hypothetical protein
VTDSLFLAAALSKRDAADVDLLNGRGQRHTGFGNRLLKRVEVDDNQINRGDSVTAQLIQMKIGASGQDARRGRPDATS